LEIDKEMFTDKNGAYWRLLVPGSYNMVVSKQGCVCVAGNEFAVLVV